MSLASTAIRTGCRPVVTAWSLTAVGPDGLAGGADQRVGMKCGRAAGPAATGTSTAGVATGRNPAGAATGAVAGAVAGAMVAGAAGRDRTVGRPP